MLWVHFDQQGSWRMALIVVYRSSADCWWNDTLLLVRTLPSQSCLSLSPHNRCANDEQVCASSAILIDLILILHLITRMVAMIIFARGVFQILMTAGLYPLFFSSSSRTFISFSLRRFSLAWHWRSPSWWRARGFKVFSLSEPQSFYSASLSQLPQPSHRSSVQRPNNQFSDFSYFW